MQKLKTGLLLSMAITLATGGCAGQAAEHIAASHMTLPAIGYTETYRPEGSPRGVALFVAPQQQITDTYRKAAVAAAAEGFAVVVLPVEKIMSALPASAACINPNQVLDTAIQSFERGIGLNRYVRPVLVGYAGGAALVYASFLQAPIGIYGGAVSIDFSPEVIGGKSWCAGKGHLSATRVGDAAAPRWRFAPAARMPTRWTVLDPIVPGGGARVAQFVSAIPSAQRIRYPAGGQGIGDATPALVAILKPMRAAALNSADKTSALSDLPLSPVTDAEAPRTDMMAIMYSGDGGWVGFDHQIAVDIASKGVPVVGVSTRDYFWTRKAPGEASRDLERIVQHYGKKWNRKRVLLIGYSFGADTLPFMVNRLPQSLKTTISRISLLGLSKGADFEFHLSSWFNAERGDAVPTVPEIGHLTGIPVQCIRGADESGSACPAISAPVTQAVLPGGHHFDSNAGLIARTVLAGIA